MSVACAMISRRQQQQTNMKLQFVVVLVLLAAAAVDSFPHRRQVNSNFVLLSIAIETNKKLRYREEHSASVVLSWCTS